MMDAANPTQLSASCVQLLGLLSAEQLAEASVLILFNKMYGLSSWRRARPRVLGGAPLEWSQDGGSWLGGRGGTVGFGMHLWQPAVTGCFFCPSDLPCYMTVDEMKSLIRLPDIIACAKQNITTAEISAQKGTGLSEVLRWLRDTHRTDRRLPGGEP